MNSLLFAVIGYGSLCVVDSKCVIAIHGYDEKSKEEGIGNELFYFKRSAKVLKMRDKIHITSYDAYEAQTAKHIGLRKAFIKLI